MSDLIKIYELDLGDKRVLIREDYNVPIRNGQVEDDTRIRASLPTLKQCHEAGAKIIIISHLGRPKEGEYDEKFSLAPVATCLSKLLGKDVPLIKNWIKGIEFGDHDIVLCSYKQFPVVCKSR